MENLKHFTDESSALSFMDTGVSFLEKAIKNLENLELEMPLKDRIWLTEIRQSVRSLKNTIYSTTI